MSAMAPASASPPLAKRPCRGPRTSANASAPHSASAARSASGPGAYARTLAGEDPEDGEATPDSATMLSPPLAMRRQADRRRVLPGAPRADPLPGNLQAQHLPRYVARAAASVPEHLWQAILRNVAKSPSGPITMTVGTACSGSELYLTALPALQSEISRRLGREFRFDHRWSCEISPRKRQWIMDNFSPPKLFADLTQLHTGRCHDFVSGQMADVEPVDILIAGTSCKDASRLNPHHQERLNVVDSGVHTTGETFLGFARLVRGFGRRCHCLLLENVVSLKDRDRDSGRSNFDGVADHVRAMGFGFVSASFSAQDTGLPIARPRLYMSGVRCADEASAQRTTDEVLQHIFHNARMLPLDALLLEETDSFLMMQDWMPEGLARASSLSGLESTELWPQQHKEAWAEIPANVSAIVATRFADNPWLDTLPARPRDRVLLTACRQYMASQRSLCYPVHTSLGWEGTGSPTYLPTLVPTGIFWLAERARPLLGVEALRLQGCDPSMLPGLRPQSHDSSFLLDLAGNAFCVYQFCAWLLAVLAVGDCRGDAHAGASGEQLGGDERAGPQR